MKGHHAGDLNLEKEYFDWFFLHHFGKGPGFHEKFSDEQITSLMLFEQEKETQTWEILIQILNGILGGK